MSSSSLLNAEGEAALVVVAAAPAQVKSEVSFKYNVGAFTVYENRETFSKEELDQLLDDISNDHNKSIINNYFVDTNNHNNNNTGAAAGVQQQPHVLPRQLAVGVEPSDVQLLISIGEEEADFVEEAPAAVVAVAEEENENEYNADGTYKHTGRKEPYIPFGSNIGEGDKVMTLFATLEFDKLKRNFAFLKNADPLSPNTRRITLNNLYGAAGNNSSATTSRMYVNPAFWSFVISEYTIHQSIRSIRAEERTNGWKKNGSKRWRADDFNSFALNNEKLPPKRLTYKPALGTS